MKRSCPGSPSCRGDEKGVYLDRLAPRTTKICGLSDICFFMSSVIPKVLVERNSPLYYKCSRVLLDIYAYYTS